MTRKGRFFSALAIAAAGTMMITTTAYQSKAANGINGSNFHVDEGEGYAGTEVEAVARLNTSSDGIFRYDAPGTDDDIEISGGDIKDLENAIKALSGQVVSLGDKAMAADMALDSSTATAIGSASAANTRAINNASQANALSLADLKASIDALNTTIKNKNFSSGSSSGGGGTATPQTVLTAYGTADLSTKASYTLTQLAASFPRVGNDGYNLLVFKGSAPTSATCIGYFHGAKVNDAAGWLYYSTTKSEFSGENERYVFNNNVTSDSYTFTLCALR